MSRWLLLLFALAPLALHADVPPSEAPLLSDLSWRSVVTIFIFLCTFTALVLEVFPPDITMLAGSGTLVIFGVLTPAEFLSGFSRDVIFTIAMLFILVRALELNGVLNYLATWIMPKEKKGGWRELFTLLPPLSAASAFMNNTPIVLAMTPIVRKWANRNEKSPSQYLMPLSFAAILGGTCSLIGSSTNLVVDQLLRSADPASHLGFFELAKIGIFLALFGLCYLIFFSYYFLPSRPDPSAQFSRRIEELAGEFIVDPSCSMAGMRVGDLGNKYFHGAVLASIQRGRYRFDAPSGDHIIRAGDQLVMVGDIDQIAQLHSVEGLRSVADPEFRLDLNNPHFSEIVVSTTSGLIGRTLRKARFRQIYGASVIAVYRQGRHLRGPIGDVILQMGDTLFLLSPEPLPESHYYNQDFYAVRYSEPVHAFTPSRALLTAGILAGMVCLAYFGVPMMIASMGAAFLCMATQCISVKEVQKCIAWNLLILIATSFGLGMALQKTGVAALFAKGILSVVGTHPSALIAGIFLVTMLCTEFVTNNAAALIMFPIALEAATQSGYTDVNAVKAIGVSIAIAASSSFLTPIGYQTNTIVYGPGGYRFTDYLKAGAPLSIIVALLASLLIPLLWPM